jgi:cytochrome P450
MKNHDSTDTLDNFLQTDSFHADPYPIYDRLREEDPVHWSDALGGWLLTRYDDVAQALRDHHRFAVSGRIGAFLSELSPAVRERAEPLTRHFSKAITHLDPPEHSPIRAQLQPMFTAARIEQFRGRIQALCEQLLDNLSGQTEFDLIADFAFPLPATVLGEVLGIPTEDCDQYKLWSDDIGVRLFGTGHATEENMEQARKSMLELYDYLSQLVELRRRKPREDLISYFISDCDFSEQELFSTCVTLVLAGHGTTTNLIGNGMLALMQNPDQLQRLRSNPTLLPSAVEELLRYDSPLQRMWRRARTDVQIEGELIREGQMVLPAMGAANRDPAKFSQPNRLDVARSQNAHLSFGYGVHLCLGADLARLQGAVAIGTLLARLPNLQLSSDQLQWERNLLHRGLKALPVSID